MERGSAYKNSDSYLEPYWKGNAVFHESVLFCSDENGNAVPAALLYQPDEILSVISAAEDIEYTEGKDYRFDGGKLELLPGSAIPCQTRGKLYPACPLENHSFPRTGGGNIYFSEGEVFHRMQTLVTYTHASVWEGPAPENKSRFLPRINGMLKNGVSPHIVVMGDSITEGANSSGPVGMPPYLGSWWQMAVDFWSLKYCVDIPCANVSMGGQISSWGAQQAPKAAADYHPDFVIIAFGMNDGSHKVPPREFKKNIASIITSFRNADSNTEFLLVGSILPNPEARDFVGFQAENRDMLLELESEGIAVADVTAMHEAFLRRKPYRDMTGNNVNHLNDFLARLQCQVVLETVGRP